MEAQEAEHFEQVLEHLRRTRGFDFTAYKRTSLKRRIHRRMQMIGVATFEQYLDRLQVDPNEYAGLFDTILINVTSFFRDAEVWELIDQRLLPDIIAKRPSPSAIRVWSAGCASGQEAYSLALLLAERLGIESLKERVKIYATDADEHALAEGRQAVYTERQLADVPEHLHKYFERNAAHSMVARELRRVVIFGRHDLLQDAPISRVDLLMCRNALMYFNADAQSRVLAKFHYSTAPEGFLVLGRAEMLFGHTAMFAAVDVKRRVFQPLVAWGNGDRQNTMPPAEAGTMTNPRPFSTLAEAAFDASDAPQIVVDPDGVTAAINGPARLLFALTTRDVGRPLRDLDVSYRPAELRAALDNIAEHRREVTIKDVRWSHAGEPRVYDVLLAPLAGTQGNALGTRITFRDVTKIKDLEQQLEHSRQEIETAYEELQSTNEELETTNEELQSTNEELQTMNDELRLRSSELNESNAFLETVFRSLHSAVVVVDREYRVQVWSPRAEDLWGLRPEEVRQAYFLNLDIGLPVEELRPGLRSVLKGEQDKVEMIVSATSRRGKPLACRINIGALRQHDRSIGGAIMLMEERANS